MKVYEKEIRKIYFVILLLCLSFNKLESSDFDEYEEGVFEFSFSPHIKTYINCILVENKVFIPLKSILDLLKIKNEFDYYNKKFEGYINNTENSFSLDFQKKEANFKSSHFVIDDSLFVIGIADVFVDPEYFFLVFKMKFSLIFSKLKITLDQNTDVPVAREYQRKKQFSFLLPKDYYQEYNLLFDRSRSYLNGMTLEYNLRGDLSKRENNYNGNLGFGLEILGGDFYNKSYFYYFPKLNNISLNNDFKWNYYISDNKLLTQISIGSIYPNNFRRSNLRSDYFEGIQISNETTQLPILFSNNEIIEKIGPGWQIQLYKDGQFIDQTYSDASGYYKLTLPLNYGTSNFELKFYGPNGEDFSRKDFYNIPSEFLPQGEIKYLLNAGYKQKEIYPFASSRVSFGIFDWLTNTTDVEYINYNKTVSVSNELSVRLSSNLFFNYVNNNNEFSKFTLNYWPLYFGSYSLNYTIIQKESYFFSNSIKSLTDISVSLPRFTSLLSFGLNNKYILRDNGFDDILNITSSSYFYPFSINANYQLIYNHSLDSNNFKQITKFHSIRPSINFYLGGRNYENQIWGPLQLSLSASYLILSKELLSIGFSLNQNLFRIFNILFIGNYDTKQKFITGNLSLRIDLPQFRSTTSGTINSDRITQEIQGLMAFQSFDNKIIINNPTFIKSCSSAGACVRVFMDANSNSIFDDGDSLISDVSLQVQRAVPDQRMDMPVKYYFSLIPYSRYNVKLDPKSIKNPNFIPKFTEFSFIADPNVIKPIDIPVLVTGIIEGTVLRERDGKMEGQAGVKIHIMSEDSSYHETQPVFSDGSFYKMGLMPGNYLAWVDSLQCAILDVYQQDTIKRFTVKSTKTGDFIEGLDFVLLDRKEKDKKKVIIETISTPIVPEEEIKIDTLVNGNGKIDDRKPAKKLTEPKFDSKDGVPNLLLLYKESKLTWLSVPMQKELDKVAKYLIENPNAKAQIDGHSDNFGTMEENMKVSEQRAKEVVNYLYRKGIALSRLYSSGHGALYPVGDNKTAQGRAKNRRVEVKIIE